ncbi:hypothetical protein B0H13DRAFT_1928275 [Mycena leptocephala]|nr:hypothetical protein B0H13DRAFT_1928275 [Mycena leptocephala]
MSVTKTKTCQRLTAKDLRPRPKTKTLKDRFQRRPPVEIEQTVKVYRGKDGSSKQEVTSVAVQADSPAFSAVSQLQLCVDFANALAARQRDSQELLYLWTNESGLSPNHAEIAEKLLQSLPPFLEAERARVADLEAQISHLERSLSALREEKFLAQERLNSYKYPVLTLPNEIMARNSVGHSRALECHWYILLRSHSLGTNTAHIFNLWLKRSGFCPLSLQIAGGVGIDEILAAVVPHRARWEHLELEGLSPSHLPIIEGPMPLLRHLSLGLDEYPATDVLAFRDAPLLRSVILDAAAVTSIMLPWAQLTSLTLRGVYSRESFLVLQKTSNLVRCELRVLDSGDHEHEPDITLPYLESLVISSLDGPVTDFLEKFIVPALRRLEVSKEFLGPSPFDSLTGFISKSGCKLEEVHIGGDPRSLRQDSYCQAFPSIRKFSFDGEDDPSDSDSSDLEDNSDSE